jgi:CubicO group peptidase (beta-lactamase class C family)
MWKCLITIIILLLPGCRAHRDTEASAYSQPAEAKSVLFLKQNGSVKEVVRDLAEPLIQSGRNIGMIVGVWTPAGESIQSFGHNTTARQTALPIDAKFQTGSVTKSFTSTLLASLAVKGKLKVSDPVLAHTPKKYQASAGELGRMTLEELASHTSGLPQEVYTGSFLWGVTSYLFSGQNLYRYFQNKHWEAVVVENRFTRSPKHTYSYSNLGHLHLGWILSKSTGQSYAELLQQHIFTPLGMSNSGLTTEADLKDLTPGYAGDLPTFIERGTLVDPWLFDDEIAASGGVHSTARDLLKYVKANLGILDKGVPQKMVQALQETHKPRASTGDGGIGLGWFIEELPSTKEPYYHIAGIIGGHTSFIGFHKEKKIGVVVLQNSINHDDRISVTLLDRLVAGLNNDRLSGTSAPTQNR